MQVYHHRSCCYSKQIWNNNMAWALFSIVRAYEKRSKNNNFIGQSLALSTNVEGLYFWAVSIL